MGIGKIDLRGQGAQTKLVIPTKPVSLQRGQSDTLLAFYELVTIIIQ